MKECKNIFQNYKWVRGDCCNQLKKHQKGIYLSKMLVLDGFLSEYYDSFLGLNTIWDSLFSLLLQVGWVYQGLF